MAGVFPSVKAAENLSTGRSLTKDETRRPAPGGALFVAVAPAKPAPPKPTPAKPVPPVVIKPAVAPALAPKPVSPAASLAAPAPAKPAPPVSATSAQPPVVGSPSIFVPAPGANLKVPAGAVKLFEVDVSGPGEIKFSPTQPNGKAGELSFKERYELEFQPKGLSLVNAWFDPFTKTMHLMADGEVVAVFTNFTNLVELEPEIAVQGDSLVLRYPKGLAVYFLNPNEPLPAQEITFNEEGEMVLGFPEALHLIFTSSGDLIGADEASFTPDGQLVLNFKVSVNFGEGGVVEGGPVLTDVETLPDGTVRLTFASSVTFSGEKVVVTDTALGGAEESLDGTLKLQFSSQVDFNADKTTTTVTDTGGGFGGDEKLEGDTLSFNFSTNVGFEKNTDTEPKAPTVNAVVAGGSSAAPGGSVGLNQDALKDGNIEITGETTTQNSTIESVEVSTDGGVSFKTAEGKDAFSYEFKAPDDAKTYSVRVRSKNEAGQESSQFSFTLTYDPGAKAAPPDITDVEVSGLGVNKNSTTSLDDADLVDGALAIAGVAVANFSPVEKVEVSTDGGSSYKSASGGDSFTFNYTPKSTKETIKVSIRAKNEAGQTSSVFSFTLNYEKAPEPEAQPPEFDGVTAGGKDAGSGDTVTLNADEAPNGVIKLEGTADTENSTLTKVEVSTNGGSSYNTASGTGTWSYQFTAASTGGTYSVKVKATNAKNQTTTYSFTVVYEGAQPPTIEAANVGETTVAKGASLTIGATALEDGKIPFSGVAEASTGTVAKVEVSTNGGATWATADGEEDWSWSLTAPASKTTYTVQVRATDTGSRVSSVHNFTLVYDPGAAAQPPEFTEVTVNEEAVDEGGEVTVKLEDVAGSAIPLAGVVSVEGSTLTKVEVSSNNGSTYTAATGTEEWTFNLTKPTTDTTLNMKVRATNAAGQTTTFAFKIVYEAAAPPPTFENLKILTRTFTSADGASILPTELQSGKIKITGSAKSDGGTVQSVTVTVNGDTIPVTGLDPFTAEFTPVVNTLPDVEITSPTVENVNPDSWEGVKLMTPDDITDGKLTIKGTTSVGEAADEYVIEVVAEDSTGQESEVQTATFNYTIPAGADGLTKVEVSTDGGSSWAAATLAGTSFTYDKTPSNAAVYEIKTRVTTKAAAAEPQEFPDTPWQVEYSSKTWKTRLEDQFKAMMAAYVNKDSPTLVNALSDVFGSSIASMGSKAAVEDNLSDRFLCCNTGITYAIDSTVLTAPYTQGSVYFRWKLTSSSGGFLSEQWIFERDEETNEFLLKQVSGNDSLLRFTEEVGSISLTANTTKLYANGQQTATITGTVLDTGGFIVRDGTRVDLSVDQGSIAPATVLVNNGQFTATYTADTSSGTADIVARDEDASVSSVALQITLKTVGTLTLAASAASLTANNADTATLTGTALDTEGVAVPNGTVLNLTATQGTVIPSSVTVTNGAFTTTYRAGVSGGVVVIIVTGGDQGATANTTVTLVEEAPPLPPGFLPRVASRKDRLIDRFKQRREAEANLDQMEAAEDDNDLSWFEDDTF